MNACKQLRLSALSLILWALMPVGAAQAQVAVTSADPASAPQGTISLDVTVNGSGFDSTAAVQFLVTGTTNPGGITVKKVVVRGSKKLIATIDVADTAVVDKFDIEVTLSGGRKGKGTSLFAVQPKPNSDPCAALNLDFPAFTFQRATAHGTQIYVADSAGQCIRPLIELTGSIDWSWTSPKFSYPVAGTTDVGRLAWTANDNTQIVNLIYVLTFRITGTSITAGTLELIYDSAPVSIAAMNLSEDGTTVYFSLDSPAPNGSARIMAIDVDSSNVQEVFVGPPDDGTDILRIAVNEDGALFVRQDSSDSGLPSNLLRIGPSCNNPACWVVLAEAPTGTYGADYPAASLVDNRLAYLERLVPYSTGCWLLQIIPDTGGPILNSAQPRYGRGALSWYGNKLLTNGYKSPTRQGRCDSTGMITQIDPDTSAETVLVRGSDPDGR